MNKFSGMEDTCVPSPAARVEKDAYTAGRIVLPYSAILSVLLARNAPKIIESVVLSIAVDVIDIGIWPRAGHHRPNNPVGLTRDGENSARPITARADSSKSLPSGEPTVPKGTNVRRCSRWSAGKPRWRTLAPIQAASRAIVFKQRSQHFGGREARHDLLQAAGGEAANAETVAFDDRHFRRVGVVHLVDEIARNADAERFHAAVERAQIVVARFLRHHVELVEQLRGGLIESAVVLNSLPRRRQVAASLGVLFLGGLDVVQENLLRLREVGLFHLDDFLVGLLPSTRHGWIPFLAVGVADRPCFARFSIHGTARRDVDGRQCDRSRGGVYRGAIGGRPVESLADFGKLQLAGFDVGVVQRRLAFGQARLECGVTAREAVDEAQAKIIDELSGGHQRNSTGGRQSCSRISAIFSMIGRRFARSRSRAR